MVRQLLQVILLLLDLRPQGKELLLLGFADVHLLLGALAPLESITV